MSLQITHGSRLNRPRVSPFVAILRQWFREFPVMSSLAVPCFSRIWISCLVFSGVYLVMVLTPKIACGFSGSFDRHNLGRRSMSTTQQSTVPGGGCAIPDLYIIDLYKQGIAHKGQGAGPKT